jgi:hypothetical protein
VGCKDLRLFLSAMFVTEIMALVDESWWHRSGGGASSECGCAAIGGREQKSLLDACVH